MGVEEVWNLVVEKLKEALLAPENLGGDALGWLDKVFPPETRGDKISHWFHVALPYLIVAVVLLVVVCFCRCCCGCELDCCGCCSGLAKMLKAICRCCCGCCRRGRPGKMMRAPGRNCVMRRSVFESDPRGYFRNLRAHPGDQLC